MWIVLLIWGCDNGCHRAAKVVPALELMDPSWGAEPVDCDIQHPDPACKWVHLTRITMQ